MLAIPSITLNDGHSIAQLGFGTWQIPDDKAPSLVREAIEAGYRHIDTAAIYRNERGVGRGIAEAGVPADQLFITTKVWNDDQGFDSTLRAMDKSLEKLGLPHVNLYLIHWPCPQKGKFLDTWKALLRLREEGKALSIGVSNFRQQDLQVLIDQTGELPAVNQIEVHPYLQQRDLRRFNVGLGIHTEAWSPLARGGELLKDPVIGHLARQYGKTPAQLVLRWHIQEGSVVFPKSSSRERILENAAVFDFELTEEDLQAIAALDKDERTGPDPSTLN